MSSQPSPDPQSGPAGSTKTNGLAVASMILGIVGILIQLFGVVPILATVLGFVGKNQIDSSGGSQGGRGMAIAGIVLGIVGLVLFIILLIAIGTGGLVIGN